MNTEFEVLFEKEDHRFVWLGWEEEEEGELVQTNQYLIVSNGKGILLDPGSVFVLPRVISSVVRFVDLKSIEHIFYTHQDPDVSSGVTVWLNNTPAKVYISKLWTRFLPHFGVFDRSRIVPIPDEGGEITLDNGKRLILIPSHFLHSAGNFCLFDEISGILFSGDIGACVFPEGKRYLFVENFEEHIQYMEGFHKRYMASSKACKAWVERVRKLGPNMIAPQHGALFRGEHVEKFLSWFETLECGVDLMY